MFKPDIIKDSEKKEGNCVYSVRVVYDKITKNVKKKAATIMITTLHFIAIIT